LKTVNSKKKQKNEGRKVRRVGDTGSVDEVVGPYGFDPIRW
jgi:hypothetical protein